MDNWEATHGYGTGALLHQPDARDHDMARIPEVAEALAAGIPDEVSYVSLINHVYNQGTLPSCVAHSTAGMQSLYQRMELQQESRIYDAEAVYWENGGDGRNGVSTIRVLTYAKDKGMPEKTTGTTIRRNRIESYAFTNDIEVICAALAVKQLVVFALLLPRDFMQGDTNSTERTNGYHQILAVGYRKQEGRLLFLNSWGANYGMGGCGSVPFSYLKADNNQNGYFYAFTTRDVLDSEQVPLPVRVITGIESAAGVPLPELLAGQEFVVRGKGFETGMGTVGLRPTNTSPVLNSPRVLSWTDDRIHAICPSVTQDLPAAQVVVTAPMGATSETQPRWTLVSPSIRVRASQPVPVAARIRSYWAWREESVRQIASGKEFTILAEGLPENAEVTVLWGTRELPIVRCVGSQRFTVAAPQVQAARAFAISIRLNTGQTVIGPPLTVFAAPAGMSISFGTPLAES